MTRWLSESVWNFVKNPQVATAGESLSEYMVRSSPATSYLLLAMARCTVQYMLKTDWEWYGDYERWVESQDLSLETKRTYLVHVRRFLRW